MPSPRLTDLHWQLQLARPFVAMGIVCVVAGGLVAAVTAMAPSEQGSWVAAYLVLVAGVAQAALGAGQALLAPAPPSRRVMASEFAAWNAGNAAVLVGTLVDVMPVVDAGGGLLVIALALWIAEVHGVSRHGDWGLRLYRLLVGLLLVSILIGLLLARTSL